MMEANVKRFVIICGGECRCDGIPMDIFENAFVIAADSGYDTATALGVTPDLLVGDMDSIKEVPKDVPLHRVKAEKDDTDTMLAASIAIDMGAEEIFIVGGGGGRADHLLSNLFLLEALSEKGVSAQLHDGINRVRFVCDESVKLERLGGYFGVLALDDCTVTAEGCKYPLKDAPLKRSHPYAVSNEVTSEYCTVTVKGRALITESIK